MAILPSVKLPSPGRVYIPSPHMPRISGKVRYRFVNKGHKIADYMKKWERTFLYRSGGAIRAYVISSLKRRKNKNIHSPIMKPPYMHLKKSEFIKPALQFAVDLHRGPGAGTSRVLVGILRSKAGFWGLKHERGGWFGRGKSKAFFPPRPFMKPAFNRWKKYGLPVILKDTREKAFGLR